MDPEKVEAVMSWERSKSVFEIRSFLGLGGYYRSFIEDFSRLAGPMTKLARNEVKFEWNDLCEGILGIEKKVYFDSYSDSPEKGTNVHSVLLLTGSEYAHKFITQLPKDYYLIPGKRHHKTC